MIRRNFIAGTFGAVLGLFGLRSKDNPAVADLSRLAVEHDKAKKTKGFYAPLCKFSTRKIVRLSDYSDEFGPDEFGVMIGEHVIDYGAPTLIQDFHHHSKGRVVDSITTCWVPTDGLEPNATSMEKKFLVNRWPENEFDSFRKSNLRVIVDHEKVSDPVKRYYALVEEQNAMIRLTNGDRSRQNSKFE